MFRKMFPKLLSTEGKDVLSKLLWCKPGIFSKDLCKITLIFKAGSHSNINQGIIGIGQQALAFLYPYHIQVFLEGRTGGLLE